MERNNADFYRKQLRLAQAEVTRLDVENYRLYDALKKVLPDWAGNPFVDELEDKAAND